MATAHKRPKHFFNAFHSPLGAHCSFTLGAKGRQGGLGLELGGPADEDIFIGCESRNGDTFQALPFFEGAAGSDESQRYDHAAGSVSSGPNTTLSSFSDSQIKRTYQRGTDTWQAGDLTFSLFTPASVAPDPAKASASELKQAYLPAIMAELTLDNTKGKRPRQAFFGYTPQGSTDSARHLNTKNLKAIIKGSATGIFTADTLTPSIAFSVSDILANTTPENDIFGLGGACLLSGEVPAGESRTFTFAICFFRGGIVTTGMPTSYLYNRYFKSIEQVARYALANQQQFKDAARKLDADFKQHKLNPAQQFQLIHAIRSYFGSTQLLEHEKRPVWVVNEGEYRMMNTFDLTVDQLFFEMLNNPWTVRNELDLFINRYSYRDKLHYPGKPNIHPGGISFTHDMGFRNHFSDPGFSAYERFDLSGCFSHMTHEQLVNWVLCATVYVKQTNDTPWFKQNQKTFTDALRSMLNRDAPKAGDRNGIMALDSSRTINGAEITTYDSLDESLGQARNNLYMAVKCWAAYLALHDRFSQANLTRQAETAMQQAHRAAQSISAAQLPDGSLPAIMNEPYEARIIPSIEGLVFPHVLGLNEYLQADGPFAELIKTLKAHFKTIMKPGICLYDDKGWKLSSSADNSWLSKIYLCQFVARKILGVRSPITGPQSDKAHANWLLNEPNLRFAWSDQMASGIAMGSKYYPRGVTAILWTIENNS